MYFGGEIIAATECDYQSSRELGLICPFCSSAVFIRSEFVRERKGKLQLVSPYFAHYPSGAADWDCEQRSRSKQGREEIEQIKIHARNQRLKLYNAHLWDMIARDRNIKPQNLYALNKQFGRNWMESHSVLVRREWGLTIEDSYKFIDAAIHDMAHQGKIRIDARPPLMSQEAYNEEFEKQSQYLQHVDQRLHRAICFEVADFLHTNTAGFAFLKVFKACLMLQAMMVLDIESIKRQSLSLHTVTIAGFLAGTHWIEQINHQTHATHSKKISRSEKLC